MNKSCPKNCGGSLHVYCTKISKTGRVRFQYWQCRACHAKPTPRYTTAPRSTEKLSCSTELALGSSKEGKACENKIMSTAQDNFDSLSSWEAAQWLGVTVGQLMELEFNSQIPPPRTLAPVTWSERDLLDWMARAQPKETE